MTERITMSKKEVSRIPIIERCMSGQLSSKKAGEIIGLSDRQIRRIKNKLRTEGVQGIVHRSRGKPSNRELSSSLKKYAVKLVKEKYIDFKPTLANEKLREIHGIRMSIETLRKEMIKVGIWTPKTRRKFNPHQPRERRFQVGELVQADGSPHRWFEDRGEECTLLVFIDDASGRLQWLQFVDTETTEAYMRAMRRYLSIHGRPLALYVDKHSVFKVNMPKNSNQIDNEGSETQFTRAMRELEIEVINANTPQAKGRVERVNQTLQDRLVKEMRLKGIINMEEGNRYLPEFIRYFNDKFSVEPKSRIDAHRPLLKDHNLEEILCIKDTRVVSKALTMRYKRKMYKIDARKGLEYVWRKTKVDVIEDLSGEVKIQYKGKNLEYKILEIYTESKVRTSKTVRKEVEKLKINQGQSIQFNLFGRTFLLWRKPDISILD